MTARCCVLIPYFNGGDLLTTSLASVDGLLDGTVDALVVDDGSHKIPARTALSNTPLAPRVEVLELPANVGIARALNSGMRRLLDRYEYIGRLDCGDTCTEDRFKVQVEYLDRHPDCAMVGTWTSFFSPSGRYLYTVRHPLDHVHIMRRMHINSAFTHASVMFRSSLIRATGLYPCDREAAEDHAYFFEIGSRHPIANIGRVHVRSLLDPGGISSLQRRRQIRSRLVILLDHFDFRPGSIYGLLRATAQLLTPRQTTVLLRTGLQRLSPVRSADR